jgi:hypothetical protein
MLVAVGAAALAVGVAPAAAHAQGPQVLSGEQVVAGRTVTAWAAPMATWLIERAKPTDCQAGQRGPMFFLYSSSGGHVKVDCTVQAGLPVMVLPAGVICWDEEEPGDEARFCMSPQRRREVVQVGVKVDGVPFKVRPRDWTGRHGFRIRDTPAATGGYYFAITGMEPGAHTIVLFDRIKAPGVRFRARTTISLTVQ